MKIIKKVDELVTKLSNVQINIAIKKYIFLNFIYFLSNIHIYIYTYTYTYLKTLGEIHVSLNVTGNATAAAAIIVASYELA